MKSTARALQMAAALTLAFASTSMAGIVGSTYAFSDSVTGTTTITDTGAGPYTDPTGASFCVGPNGDGCVHSGLFGSYTFADVDATDSTITFNFSGSTDFATGSFSIDLGNFVTLDVSTITGVTYGSGNISSDFTNVSWNGTDAIFTGTPSDAYSAVGGRTVVFDVTTATPEPAPFALLGLGFSGLAVLRRRLKRSA